MNSSKQLLNKVRPVLWLAVAGVTLFLLFVGFWILDKVLAYGLANSYVSKISDTLDINRHLAEAITLVVALAIALCSGLIFSLSKQRRLIGLGGCFALLVLNSLVLWRATSGQFVDRSGQALKCYFFVGDQLVFGERPGFDPVTGRQCRPITPEILERLNRYQLGQKPKEIVQSDASFFDQRSGEPRIWYVRTKEGRLRLFDLPGFDPETGLELSRATSEIAAEWPKQHATARAAAEKTRRPNPVDPKTIDFFNTSSGAPTVWYWRSADGDFEFFDNEGYHPRSGDKLLPVSKEVIADYRKRQSHLDEEKRAAELKRIEDERIERERIAKAEDDRRRAEEERRRADEERRRADEERRRLDAERAEQERIRVEQERQQLVREEEQKRIEKERRNAPLFPQGGSNPAVTIIESIWGVMKDEMSKDAQKRR